MDPVSLSILFGAGALIGYASKRNAQMQNRDDSIVLRRVYETGDGWLCTELMSAEALNAVGQIMDLDLLSWWPRVQTGVYRVLIMTQPGAPISRQIVVLLETAGDYGWFLNQAQKHGYRRVNQRIDYQRIQQLVDHLNKDPADEVVKTAVQITDPVKRYHYLRYALTANPTLSAILSKDSQFLDVIRRTVKAPSVAKLKHRSQKKIQSAPPLLPEYTDLREEEEIVLPERVEVRR